MRLIIALLCAAALLLFSCTSAPKHFAKALSKDRPYVAEQTRALWPCIVTASDTVNTTDTLYDLIEADCPPVQYVTKEGQTVTIPGKTTFVQWATVYRDRIITEKIKDSADTYLLLTSLQEQKDRIAQLDKDKADITSKRNKWRKWCLLTWGMLAFGIAGKILINKIKPSW